MNDSRRLFVGLMADECVRNAVESARSVWVGRRRHGVSGSTCI